MEDKTIEWPRRPTLKKTNRQTVTNVVDRKPEKTISRRNFLKKVAAITGGAAVTYLVGKKVVSGLSADGEKHGAKAIDNTTRSEVGPKPDFNKQVSENISTVISENFGHLTPDQYDQAVKISQEMVGVIQGNPSYDKMLAVTKKHAKQIKSEAKVQNFPQDLAIGVIFIENGGGEDLESPAGGVGVGQFLSRTAREYGLRVDDQVDERKDPVKSIPIILRKLKNDSDLFGGKHDIGTWLYHGGLGNGYKALQIHYRHTTDVDLGDITEMETPEAIKLKNTFNQLIRQDGLSVHTLLQDEAVRTELMANLEDETELYPYKAVAAAALFKAETETD